MNDFRSPADVQKLLEATFENYAARRIRYYEQRGLLGKLLGRNLFLLSLRGVKNVDEFIEASLTAHEAASEETMLGNAWQAAIVEISPHVVGGGDLRVERDGELWIIQLKLSPKQNASAKAQDLRMLREKLLSERDHHPGRRGVKAMMAFVTGNAREQWMTHRSRSPANADIDGFQYQLMIGRSFLTWIGAEHDPAQVVQGLADVPATVRSARQAAMRRLKDELTSRLSDRGLVDTMESIMEFAGRR